MIKSQADAWLLFSDDKNSPSASDQCAGHAVASQAAAVHEIADHSAAAGTGDPGLCRLHHPAGDLLSRYPSAPLFVSGGGLLKDRIAKLAAVLPVPLKVHELPDWQAVRDALLRGHCDIVPHVGPISTVLPDMLVSRAMMETDAAILYRGDLEHATFLVPAATSSGRMLRALYPNAVIRQLPKGRISIRRWRAAKGMPIWVTTCNCVI